jgi:hypothetical protein
MDEATTVVNVRLPRRVHDGLKQEAIRRRSTVSGLLAEAAARLVAEASAQRSIAEGLGDLIGCLDLDHTDGIGAADVKRVFADDLVEKHRAGSR